jgi:hypothetical protein
MPEYQCSICKYTSFKKYHLERHLEKQIKCGDGIPKIIDIPIEFACEYCKKIYKTNPSMKRHLKTCKVKKVNIEKELALEKEQVKKLKGELMVAQALNNKPNTTIGTQINNIHITLSAWNDPRLPEDVEKYYREAIKKVFLAVPTLIKLIHFNSDHPENHNICIKNARNKVAKVYNGKEWESIDEDELIQTLITDYEQTLEDYSDEKNLKYNAKIQEIKDRDTEEKVYDDLHNLVKRTIYDRNYMIKIKN